MRSIDYYMELPYRMEIVKDTAEGGYVASYPELKGCITCAATADEALRSAVDAKKAWIEAALEDGYPIPEPETDEAYSGQFKFRMPRSLHRSLAEHAKAEGISMNQYCLYLLSSHDAIRSVKNAEDHK